MKPTLPMNIKSRYGIACLLLMAATLLITFVAWVAQEVTIDQYLDKGGAWDKQRSLCVTAVGSTAAQSGQKADIDQGMS